MHRCLICSSGGRVEEARDKRGGAMRATDLPGDAVPLPPDAPREAFALPPGTREGYAVSNGVAFHYVAAGERGPLVLLLHGFPEFWYSWRAQLPALGQHFRVVAPDLRGYNLSGRTTSGYDIRTLCADIAGLIDAFGEREAMVVGHDWGGVIAWALAIRAPERVRRLVILNAPHPGTFLRELRRPRQLRRSWYVGLFQLPRLPERLIARHDYAAIRAICRGVNRQQRREVLTDEDTERFVAAIARPGALTAAINYYRALLRHGPAALGPLRQITAPTLVLWGERDPALGVYLLNGLERWVRELEVRRFPDAGHWLNQEYPAEVNAALLAFLGERSDAAPD
jgi:pimeloyl-ACP methyl ester carboxylesterase